MLSSRKGASGRVHSESACTESELSMIALAANQELAVLGHGDGETLTTFSARRHRPRPDVKLKAEYKAMAEELGDSNGLGTACNTIGITLEKKGDLPNTARALVQGLVAYQRVERGSMEVCADEIGLLAESRSKIIACIPCRQLKRRCEDVRPCRSCTLRGCANECVDDGRSSACALCRSRRVKCDRQRPCSRCVQRGLGHACRSLHPPALGLADTQEDWEEDAAGTGKDSEEISMALPVGLSSSKSQAMRGILLQHFAIQRPIKRKFAVDLSECPGWDEIGRVLKRLSLDYCFQQAGDGSGDNPLVRFFEAGWNLHSGMRLFNYLPRDVKMALDEGMHTLMKLQLLIREMNRPPSTHAASSTPLHAIGAGQAHLEGLGPSAASTGAPHTPVSPHTPASASGSVLGHPHGPLIAGAAGNRVRDDGAAADVVVDSEEDKREYFAGLIAKYGMSPECGVYSFQWDPETGRRVSVQVSESLSDMLGMHTEEFLARVGRYLLPPPPPPLFPPVLSATCWVCTVKNSWQSVDRNLSLSLPLSLSLSLPLSLYV